MRRSYQKTLLLFSLLSLNSVFAAVLPVEVLSVQSGRKPIQKQKPEQKKDPHFYVQGEYLWWRVNEDGLTYAIKSKVINGVDITTEGNLHFKQDSGFRLEAGYRLPQDRWSLSLQWTRFATAARGHITGFDNNTSLFPQLTNTVTDDPTDQNPLSKIAGHWKLHLNLLNGDLTGLFQATRFLTLKPHIGIQGAWIDQHYLIKHYGGIAVADPNPPVTQTNAKRTLRFKGVGLRAGLDSNWNVFHGWGLYGNGVLSLLYGSFHLKGHDLQSVVGNPPLQLIFTEKFDNHQVVAFLDLSAGIKWSYAFPSRRVALCLALGWELDIFFDQNKLVSLIQGAVSNSTNKIALHEDLTLQGLVASARLDF